MIEYPYYKVKLVIKVKKYFCSNDKCPHTIFAEPLDFVEKNAIRTKRLDDYINHVGLKTSSMEAEKLKLFKKVKTVTRDFLQTYKNAINEALSKVKQIVDRFHIFKNLIDDLNEYIKRNIKETIKMIDTKGKAVMEEEIILKIEEKEIKKNLRRKNGKLYRKFKNYIKKGIIKAL